MELIPSILVKPNWSTREAGLGIANSSYSQTDIIERIQKDVDLGIDSFLLFITPDTKTWLPTWDFQAEVVNKIKNKFPTIQLIVDVCLCSTLPDGHCRVIDKPDTSESLLIDLGRKLETAGADVLAPSDMGDNTVTNLKQETKKEVMAYVKWRSVFYSSFRDLAESSSQVDVQHQLPVDNGFGMVATANQYKSQKADYILLKPAQHSLDDISLIRSNMYIPVGLYQVSDEYRGLPSIQHQVELCQVYRRAGANFLVTYGARDIKEHWKND